VIPPPDAISPSVLSFLTRAALVYGDTTVPDPVKVLDPLSRATVNPTGAAVVVVVVVVGAAVVVVAFPST
jgi:hypothetical protein